MSMFCYQCEQTTRGTGCTTQGVCGKDATTATLQDLLVYAVKGIAQYGHRARGFGIVNQEVDCFLVEALFTTVTNVNFDAERLAPMVHRAMELREGLREQYEKACLKTGKKPEAMDGPASWTPAPDLEGLIRQGQEQGVERRRGMVGDDRVGLESLCLYGLKGMAAYADHALLLGHSDTKVFAFFHEALDLLTRNRSLEELTTLALKIGEMNISVMGLLDAANTKAFGHPVPTKVRITPIKGKAILVSGHDLHDLRLLLEQTQGKGIKVYTHGEMLPAHGYPGLKKFAHLVGNYGSAWQKQREEFDAFPGPILMTTNCIQKPKDTYQGRIFTTGLVAYPGVRHVKNGEFGPVIEAALTASGFTTNVPEKTIMVGFARNAVLGLADQVIKAIKSGAIRHFFLIGGCDGAKPGRDYYTQFAEKVPQDCVILTLACGKYRFNTLDLGTIDGIPRLLDVGQCNDAYSAVQIALALGNALGKDINSLPLSLILSWYEQKAVAILLSLLHLGIKNIRLGPTVPAFVTPSVLEVLVKTFNLMPIRTPEEDLSAILGTT